MGSIITTSLTEHFPPFLLHPIIQWSPPAGRSTRSHPYLHLRTVRLESNAKFREGEVSISCRFNLRDNI
jgi:hypothetical protein